MFWQWILFIKLNLKVVQGCFKEAVLLVKRVLATSVAASIIEKGLEKGRTKYMVDHVNCKTVTVPPGNRSVIEDRLFQGKIPNRIIVVFVDNEAFHGSYSTNPLNF